MKIQWQGDNLQRIEQLLAPYGSVRVHDHGTKALRIVAKEFARQGEGVEMLSDVDIFVNLGDTICYRRGLDGMSDQIGIERPPDPGDDGEITWTGQNPFEVSMFIRKHDLSVSMNDRDLILKEGKAAREAQQANTEIRRSVGVLTGTDSFIRMHVGDKLILKGGCLFMSRAGKDHRA